MAQSTADIECDLSEEDDAAEVIENAGPRERRQQLAKQLQEQREDEVLDLHTARSAHYIDNAFSLVTANMAVVSLVLGAVYMPRQCAKPLSSFLVVLGVLAPFAACLPILVRQWFYLHLRLRNVVTIGLLVTSALYVVWLLLGQRWAFACSSKNCDQDLSTATNVVVFVLYVMLLLYAAKVVWYLALRARYSYKQLCLSCFQDPYPNALHLSDLELAHLDEGDEDAADSHDHATAKRHRASSAVSDAQRRKQKLLLDMQRHQRELRRSMQRLFRPTAPTRPSSATKVAPLTETDEAATARPSGSSMASATL